MKVRDIFKLIKNNKEKTEEVPYLVREKIEEGFQYKRLSRSSQRNVIRVEHDFEASYDAEIFRQFNGKC